MNTERNCLNLGSLERSCQDSVPSLMLKFHKQNICLNDGQNWRQYFWILAITQQPFVTQLGYIVKYKR